jgi:hypothetical protein
VRPQIYYNRALDEFDNPEMGYWNFRKLIKLIS